MTTLAAPPLPTPTAPAALTALAVVSLLHEPPAPNSATRLLHGHPVLAHTLARISRVGPDAPLPIAVLCWSDQTSAVRPLLPPHAALHDLGPRTFHIGLETVATARRWSDGWRGGLLATCHFDRGFHAPTLLAALDATGTDAALLVDPAAPFVDPDLLAALLDHAACHPDRPLVFSQAAPGLSGVLLRKPLVLELLQAGSHPGRALHYIPERYAHDPIATPACLPTPPPLARTLLRFTADDPIQLQLMEQATAHLAPPVSRASRPCPPEGPPALTLLQQLSTTPLPPLPRDLRLDLTSRRSTRPVFLPAPPARQELPLARWLPVLDQLADSAPSTRLTLAGLGDPLLHPDVLPLISAAAARHIPVALETDLVGLPESLIDALATAPLDVLLVHLPAATRATYAAVMGTDALEEALANINRLIRARRTPAGQIRGVPIVVPVFTKLKLNLAEMEPWYDHYLKALGSAVIDGPSTYAGLLPDPGVADMSPPQRIPCRRLSSRLQLLPDATATPCEYDLTPTLSPGSALTTPLTSLWQSLTPLRTQHQTQHHSPHSLPVLCTNCTEWHRP